MMITKEQLEVIKTYTGELRPGYGVDCLNALIAVGERLADGTHVLVPVKPTEAIIEAWSIAKPENWDHENGSAEEANRAWATADWQAMIAAAK